MLFSEDSSRDVDKIKECHEKEWFKNCRYAKANIDLLSGLRPGQRVRLIEGSDVEIEV